MALFKKRKKGKAPEPQTGQADAAEAAAPRRRRRPAETLSSVVSESAPGAAIDLMARNEAFVLPNGAGWVVLLLHTGSPAFGGLSLKQRGDEAKGSIIELIAGDQIQVVATARMLENDVLGIIPNEATLRRLNEYGILRDAAYAWGVISDDDGSLEENAVAEATYADAWAVCTGKSTLQQQLPDVWAWAGGSDGPVSAADEPTALEPATAPQGDEGFKDASEDPFGVEDAPAVEPEPEQASVAATSPDEDDGFDYADLDVAAEADSSEQYDDEVESLWADDEEPVYDEDVQDESDYDAQDDDAGSYEQYLEEHADREVTEHEVRESIVRRFSEEDLDLSIDVDEFDKTFSTDVPAVSIDVGESNDWLGGQVSLIAAQANVQLAQLHTENLAELRQQYVEIMSIHAEKIARDMSLTADGSRYSALLRAAEIDYASDKESATEETAHLRKEITDRFEAEAEEVAEAAATEARSRFHRQNRPTRERLLSEAGVDVDRRGEERFAENRRSLMETRRRDAGLHMEMGVTRALQLLSERQAEHREAEIALLSEWTDRIMGFIDENRKNDVAHTEALAEQLARQNAVADLTEQFAREREVLQAEAEARVSALQAEMIAQRDEALAKLRSRDESWQHRMAEADGRATHANALVQALTEQLGTVGKGIEDQYARRIEDLEADKRGYSEELERAGQIQKRANTTMLILIIALTLAGVLVGVILGWVLGQGSQADAVAATALAPWTSGWWPTA